MAGETYLTMSGNLTATPKSGHEPPRRRPWTRMRVASSSRIFDRQATEWRDGETLFLDVICWRRLAENAAATLERGDRVLVVRPAAAAFVRGPAGRAPHRHGDGGRRDRSRPRTSAAQLLRRVGRAAQPAERTTRPRRQSAGPTST